MYISEKLIKSILIILFINEGRILQGGKVTEMEVQQYYYKDGAFYVYEIVATVEAAYYDEYYIDIIVSEKVALFP